MGLGGLGGGVGSNLLSSKGGPTYIDDVFNTYLWNGDGSSLSINSGIDNTKGGAVFTKVRTGDDFDWNVRDTVQGGNKFIAFNTITAPTDDSTGFSFLNSGYTTGTYAGNSYSGREYLGYNFRKQEGFFTVVEWTGTGVAGATVNHDLGCVPGCIIVRRISDSAGNAASGDWTVYHTSLGGTKSQRLNAASASATGAGPWNDIAPTDAVITLGSSGDTNEANSGYIAYVFAGANVTRWSDMISPASGYFDQPASLAFDGYLGSTTNRLRTSGNAVVCTMTISPAITIQAGQSVVVYGEDYSIGNPYGYSGTATVTIDGTTYTSSTGAEHTFSTSGQLTQITYVNNSGSGRTTLEGIRVNGDLLTDGSFFVNGNPNYTDGEESKFGADEDQSLIKCGAYTGNGSPNGPVIRLGWEPQFLLVKNIDKSQNWTILDSMRGLPTEVASADAAIYPNSNSVEEDRTILDLDSTGFHPKGTGDDINGNGDQHIYIAIRFPDGYIGKPALAATDVFTVTNSPTDGLEPWQRTTNQIVDYGIFKDRTATHGWSNSARLMQDRLLKLNTNAAQTSHANQVFDYMNGWNDGTDTTGNYTGWMWKRNVGFDVVTYKGDGEDGHYIEHSMNAVPEMIWVKRRNTTGQWIVGHIGLDGGTAPWTHYMTLETTDAEGDYPLFYDTAPTSKYFKVGGHAEVNGNSNEFIAMLFASNAGISKVGYYTGNSTADRIIPTGFQPRFIIIRRCDATDNWYVIDTTRGLTKQLRINSDAGQIDTAEQITFVSTGFQIPAAGTGPYNSTDEKFIYYVHA